MFILFSARVLYVPTCSDFHVNSWSVFWSVLRTGTWYIPLYRILHCFGGFARPVSVSDCAIAGFWWWLFYTTWLFFFCSAISFLGTTKPLAFVGYSRGFVGWSFGQVPRPNLAALGLRYSQQYWTELLCRYCWFTVIVVVFNWICSWAFLDGAFSERVVPNTGKKETSWCPYAFGIFRFV